MKVSVVFKQQKGFVMNKFRHVENNVNSYNIHDGDIKFRIIINRNKYVALWVSEILGLNIQEMNKYVNDLSDIYFSELDHEAIVEKIHHDLSLHNIMISKIEIKEKLTELEELARAKILNIEDN